MNEMTPPKLRRGWTTGACATAAVKAALTALWGQGFSDQVCITLPKGETPDFEVINTRRGVGWAEAGIIKDAGDDPDVTHGCEVRARVQTGVDGVTFTAGRGVGTVTKPGLPIGVGQAAINPKPREMMQAVVSELAAKYGQAPDVEICISIVNGEKLAEKTWNPRLGIMGGLSVLGTTGVVRPFSCSAWIASIQRGVDVARASGLSHVAGCTGATSESAVQKYYNLPDHAMLDMGDFAGGLLKYLRRHPVERLTIGGGIAKMTKLAQGAVDLHSGRSQVDFGALAEMVGDPRLEKVNTALQAYEISGEKMSVNVAESALLMARKQVRDTPVRLDVIVIDRAGNIIAKAVE
ncbi:MAG TPA: cobalt-precorrin-5B (C(1))-methyltransferase [Rhodobacteraceae bacterium]|nr:cobalt-precorrin-5B (C(1))-methyltransferase [Paracoccaceae bacterium]